MTPEQTERLIAALERIAKAMAMEKPAALHAPAPKEPIGLRPVALTLVHRQIPAYFPRNVRD